MDTSKHPTASPEGSRPADASFAAESVRSDFSGLIEIFDRHLDTLADGDSRARRHIFEARAAAERGLRLSYELIALMKG